MLEWKTIGRALESRLNQVNDELDLTKINVQSAGVTLTSGDGVAVVSGLFDCVLGELIEFDGGGNGVVMNLDRETVGVVLLGGDSSWPL